MLYTPKAFISQHMKFILFNGISIVPKIDNYVEQIAWMNMP